MFRITTATLYKQRGILTAQAARAFTAKAPGANPLEVIKKECLHRNLCDEHGYRRPGVHWVLSVAVTPEDPTKVCPSLIN
jgi:hypothetical protein